MKVYRLDISHKGKLAGQLELKGEDGWELARILHNAIPAPHEWEFNWLESDTERRILESSPEGMKIIISERIYKSSNCIKTKEDNTKP